MKLNILAAAGLATLSFLPLAAGASAAPIAATGQAGITVERSDAVTKVDYRGRGWRHHERRWNHKLSTHRISRKLRRQGFTPVRYFDTRGRVYSLAARGRRGAPVMLRVNAYNGHVISVNRIGPKHRRHDGRHHGGWRHR
ncbi:hypothetical protein NYQ83_14750 [Afifella sp. JA880]|uniref:hypothetical protein n=1 Tax=Afifella sp. JA880 TaxID=2975280 RepID=UPI0021BB6E76|nr:hypothetical protein [Afifella sp. JA880]MCT8268537.1 hypothetical protein [Afifella sp. JA880]